MTIRDYFDGWTLKQLESFCRRSGLDLRSVYRWRSSESTPTPENAELIRKHTDGRVSLREALGIPKERAS